MIYKKKLIKFEENLKLNKCTKFDMEAPRKRNLVSYKEDEKLQALQKALIGIVQGYKPAFAQTRKI